MPIANIDFDGTYQHTYTSGDYWNLMPSSSSAYGSYPISLKDPDNTAITGWTSTVSASFTGATGAGHNSADGDFVVEAVRDGMYMSSGTGTVVLGGLNNAKTYYIQIKSSRDSTGTDRHGDFTVNGGTAVDLDASSNSTSGIGEIGEWTGVSPSSGNITIDVAIASGSSFAYLSAIIIEEEAGGSNTLTADSGTYTLTGTAAALTAQRKLSASSGSYSLTGTGVDLNRGYDLGADSGAYTLTGSAATLTASRDIQAASGTYTLTGTDVDLIRAYRMAADSGSYALSGTDVALTYTTVGAYGLVADSGSYNLTGSSVSLLAARDIQASSGTYTLTGSDVSLVFGRYLAAESGTYTLSGTDVDFANTYVLQAESGTYLLTGSNVAFDYSGSVLYPIVSFNAFVRRKTFTASTQTKSWVVH